MGPGNSERGRTGIPLFKIRGIQIRVDYSWFFIFLLVLWSLSMGYFPQMAPQQSVAAYWLAGFIATLLFFICLLTHELAHSLVAIRLGTHIPAITLFIFGGMAHLSEDPRDPKTELKIAAMGPFTSLLLAGIFWGLGVIFQSQLTDLSRHILGYLAWINLALAVFNLIPGFPLDGGRMFRAWWWWRTGSIQQATKIASNIGKGFAVCLIIVGALEIFSGFLLGGIWLIFIGMFLRGLAQAGYQQLLLKRSLAAARVKEMMIEDIVTIPSESRLKDAIQNFFLRYGYRGFPVIRNGSPVGLISLRQIVGIPETERERKTVDEVMIPAATSNQIAPDTTLEEALQKMTQENLGRLLVMDDGKKMAGMITRTGLLRYLEFKRELDTGMVGQVD